ncbi:TIR domain-containing protein [Paractinoplanes toevensis]|uniref:TIR domain-containing protein n=1 Tax=Paractinoplanes toevensis TaxID=571911 RepID=A0A919W6U8_9ACTN|nr:TIR domain-containing protein [Actinoplanes toevensis]GIM95315.1 hypothetical protein Ato02nite_071080 [Actinoplanes toevensis]
MTDDLHPALRWRARLSDVVTLPLSCSWSLDGSRLALANRDVAVWALRHGNWQVAWRWQHGVVPAWPRVEWSPTAPDLFAVVYGQWAMLYRISRSGSPVWQERVAADNLLALSFSPSGTRLAVCDGSHTIKLLSVADGSRASWLELDHPVDTVSWSPLGEVFAVQTAVGAFLIHEDAEIAPKPITSRGLSFSGMVWSRDGRMLGAADQDFPLLHVWNSEGRQLAELEVQSDGGRSAVSFSPDGRLLYAADAVALRCWRTDTWQSVMQVDLGNQQLGRGLTASPAGSLLAIWDRSGGIRGVDIYEVDTNRLLGSKSHGARTYRNAKVVLVGETGVGKSGLGLVLSNQPYRPTDSTHARQVYTFEETEAALPDGGSERRETLLWDMAGQSGYRLIHQLHLAEAAAALVVFDARSETDPFSGVRYWARALHQQTAAPAILVAARTDRGGVAAGDKRIAAICKELALTGYFQTSAREGRQIRELANAIRAAIDWDSLPLSVSTELFETIKQFLLRERKSRRVLATADDLYRDFRRYEPSVSDSGSLRSSFDACVRLLELRDVVRRLSFGDFVLLQPEMLDFYASSLIDEARAQPDGLGYLPEVRALAGQFPIPQDGRLARREERLLLIAVIEELLRHDLAQREVAEDGVDLVFPSQLTADRPVDGEPEAADVLFRFDGAVTAIYATLAVRLSRVSAYVQKEMWRNGSTYRAKVGGVCGVRVLQPEEGRGELAVFFDADASEETRFLFEDYVHAHLTARALARSVRRERIFSCPGCGYRVDSEAVRRRLERGATDVLCADCEQVRISLLDREDRLASASAVRDMNASADAGRDAAANTATIRGKEVTKDFDVFLSYNTADHNLVARIAERLRAAGVLAWFAPVDLVPGARWRNELERQIAKVRAGAVFLGPHGMGTWQKMEEELLVNESARRDLRIIPVLLPGHTGEPAGFLSQWQAADFRRSDPDPFARLLAGITQ